MVRIRRMGAIYRSDLRERATVRLDFWRMTGNSEVDDKGEQAHSFRVPDAFMRWVVAKIPHPPAQNEGRVGYPFSFFIALVL